MSSSRLEKVWRPLAADIRQAIVGWVVLLGIPLVGGLLLAAFVGEVPAWSLALAIVMAVLLVAAISLEHRRELGRTEGELRLEQKRRGDVEKRLAILDQSAGSGEPPLSSVQRGLIFRVKAVRGTLEERRQNFYETSAAQDRVIRNLANDVGEQAGSSQTLTDIILEWEGNKPDRSIDDALTVLGQLEGLVLGLPTPRDDVS